MLRQRGLPQLDLAPEVADRHLTRLCEKAEHEQTFLVGEKAQGVGHIRGLFFQFRKFINLLHNHPLGRITGRLSKYSASPGHRNPPACSHATCAATSSGCRTCATGEGGAGTPWLAQPASSPVTVSPSIRQTCIPPRYQWIRSTG